MLRKKYRIAAGLWFLRVEYTMGLDPVSVCAQTNCIFFRGNQLRCSSTMIMGNNMYSLCLFVSRYDSKLRDGSKKPSKITIYIPDKEKYVKKEI